MAIYRYVIVSLNFEVVMAVGDFDETFDPTLTYGPGHIKIRSDVAEPFWQYRPGPPERVLPFPESQISALRSQMDMLFSGTSLGDGVRNVNNTSTPSFALGGSQEVLM